MNGLGLVNFVTRNIQLLKRRSVLIDLISVPEKRYHLPSDIVIRSTDEKDTYYTETNVYTVDPAIEKSPIVVDDKTNTIYGCGPYTSGVKLYKLHDQLDTPIMDIYDEFTLNKGIITNYIFDQPIITTYGLFILNYIVLADPLGPLVPYINDIFNWKYIQNIVANAILDKKIGREEYDKFINNTYYIGSFTELSVPNLTVKAMTPNKDILKRRDELFAKYKNQLNDPLIVAKIEDELIAMDKKALANDPAFFWIIDGGDWDMARKKMFITSGVTEAFSEDTNEFTFTPGALSEKMDFTKFSAIANDIRRGSYMRGKETAKGGEETKFVLRIFQNVRITEEDCHSTDGITVVLTANQYNLYRGRHVIDNGEDVILTQDNFGKYIERPIKIRSPMHCHAKDGFCFTCFGEIYKKIALSSVGMRVVEASSALMSAAMSAIHKSKIKVIKLDDLDAFVL